MISSAPKYDRLRTIVDDKAANSERVRLSLQRHQTEHGCKCLLSWRSAAPFAIIVRRGDHRSRVCAHPQSEWPTIDVVLFQAARSHRRSRGIRDRDCSDRRLASASFECIDMASEKTNAGAGADPHFRDAHAYT